VPTSIAEPRRGWDPPRPTVAVAESLTGGLLCSRFARQEGAGDWFRGGVVAYARMTKERLLDIGDAPVVSEAAVRSMAANVAELLSADVAIAVTGVGGPDPEDGIPPGTVWIATYGAGATDARLFRFDGDPLAVCDQTCDAAEALLRAHLDDLTSSPSATRGEGVSANEGIIRAG
jgi:nicotinamide-nucleotide amidase